MRERSAANGGYDDDMAFGCAAPVGRNGAPRRAPVHRRNSIDRHGTTILCESLFRPETGCLENDHSTPQARTRCGDAQRRVMPGSVRARHLDRGSIAGWRTVLSWHTSDGRVAISAVLVNHVLTDI
jgi:hypothetical protein